MLNELLTFLRQPVDKRDYRAIAVVGVLGVLVGAALGLAAMPRWEMAAVGALLALPGSLFLGVLYGPLERAKQQMQPQMTSTGVKTPLAGLLVLLVVIGAVVWRMSGAFPSFATSFGIAFQLFLGSALLRFLAAWLYGSHARGQTLLDCGPHPHRTSYLVAAVISPILALSRGLPIGSSATVYGIAFSLVLLLAGILLFFMAGARLQVCENGIWKYWSLLRWRKIQSYHWADDGTWTAEMRGISFLRHRPLLVPSEYRDAFDRLLQEHGVVEDTKRG